MTSIYPSQTRTLTLHTYAITQQKLNGMSYKPGYSSPAGFANDRVTDVTWTNISLRRLLDDALYYKYRRFNLVLRQFATDAARYLGSMDNDLDEQYNDRSIAICMTGPTWAHNWSIEAGTTTAEAELGYFIVPYLTNAPDEAVCQYFSTNSIRTFTLDGLETIDINLKLRRTCDGQLPIMGADNTNFPTNYPNWTAVFEIYPVLDSKIDENNNNP